MPPTSSAAKICIRCNQDCSAKPRTKDPAGRYTCKSCLEQAQLAAKNVPRIAAPRQAAPPAARPDEPDDNAMMAKLLEESAAAFEPCAGCGPISS